MLPNTAFLKCNYTGSVVSTVAETEEQQTYCHQSLEPAIIAPVPSTIDNDDALHNRRHSSADLRQRSLSKDQRWYTTKIHSCKWHVVSSDRTGGGSRRGRARHERTDQTRKISGAECVMIVCGG